MQFLLHFSRGYSVCCYTYMKVGYTRESTELVTCNDLHVTNCVESPIYNKNEHLFVLNKT